MAANLSLKVRRGSDGCCEGGSEGGSRGESECGREDGSEIDEVD